MLIINREFFLSLSCVLALLGARNKDTKKELS